MLRAAVFPFLVKASRFLRSSSVSVTRYFFWFIDFPRCCSFSLLFGVRLPSNYSIHAGQPSCTDVLSTIRSTLGEALVYKYLTWCRKHRSPRTVEWYEGHLRGFLD